MGFNSEGKRKPYIPPQIKKVTEYEAKQLLAAATRMEDSKVAKLLDSLEHKKSIKAQLLESA